MSGAKILMILSAICFSIGAVIGAFGGGGIPVNWISAGLAFYAWSVVVGH